MPAQRTSTTTSPCAALGSSTTCSTSGVRSRSMRMARMDAIMSRMDRREFLGLTVAGAAAAAALARPLAAAVPADAELEEITIGQLQDGMRGGQFTAVALAEQYLARIDAID